MPEEPVVVLPDLRRLCTEALIAAETLAGQARQSVAALVGRNGRADEALPEREQLAAHGLARMNTYLDALRQHADWDGRVEPAGAFESRSEVCGEKGGPEVVQ